MPAITGEVVWDVIAKSATDAVIFTRLTRNTSTADFEKRCGLNEPNHGVDRLPAGGMDS